ncbi:hypothetical protein Ccrd_016424 [Cynara cardunculus var. scolymus]|uniref:Uncharacterized protein n=1 Tax=Cynara cardunculus var. scolymus TaxID=59895 RepID=A0A103Y9Y0_CYNCS|nr:hypothetical protein Ccrd_016424 [Cynara cardunculus var. scolymus]
MIYRNYLLSSLDMIAKETSVGKFTPASILPTARLDTENTYRSTIPKHQRVSLSRLPKGSLISGSQAARRLRVQI